MKLITENELHSWVDSHEQIAQGLTVELVARLARAQCPSPKQFRFPLRDSLGQHGFDGWMEVAESFPPYINEGFSVWEIGSNAKPGTKITGDYTKRFSQIGLIPTDISKITFVFVTPRSAYHTLWTPDKQMRWREDRIKDGWKDIKIFDATMLCDWLSHFPAVAAWLRKEMTGHDCHIETPLTRWEALENIPEHGSRHLIPEVFLSSRDDIISKVKLFLQSEDSQTLRIQTRYPDHLADFVAALVKNEENPEQGDDYGNILILDKADDLKNFIGLEYPHVFVFGEEEDKDRMLKLRSQARRKGHRLIIPQSPGGRIEASDVILTMPDASYVQLSLQHAGFPALEAQSLAVKSNGNIPCLLRLLDYAYGEKRYWGGQNEQAILAMANLIGKWDEQNCADLQIVAEITGKTYEEWKKELALLSGLATTPLRHRDDGTYYFVSRYEGWQIGGSFFLQEDLERFFIIAERVLLEVARTPFTDPFQKILAASKNEKQPVSDNLISAIVEMLAIIGNNAKFWEQGHPEWIENRVHKIVVSVLGGSESNIWISLNKHLPLLAEAAPRSFVKCLELVVSSDQFIANLSGNIVTSLARNPIVGLLWAIECLAWSPEFFSRSVMSLGHMSKVILPENLSNRPSRSLKEIFSIWKPHTSTSTDSKALCLVELAKLYPSLAWSLITAISPYGNANSISFGTYMPHWMMVDAESSPIEDSLTLSEWLSKFEHISFPALEFLLNSNELSLVELAHGISSIPQKGEEILSIFAGCYGTPRQKEAWELLSKMLSRVGSRERFGSFFAKISATINLLSPADRYEHLKIYFGDSIPNYNDSSPFEQQLKDWQDKQFEITDNIKSEDGINGILRFIHMVKMPGVVGVELAKLSNSEDDAFFILKENNNTDNDGAYSIFLSSYIQGKYALNGDEWLHNLWERANNEVRVNILLNIPFMRTAWDLVETLPEALQQAYWLQVPCRPGDPGDDLEYPINKLIEVKRGGELIQWVYCMSVEKKYIPTETLKKILLNPLPGMQRQSYIISNIIKYLQNEIPSCDEELATIELLWIKLFHNSMEQKPVCLNKKLLTDAEFFVYALCFVYKPRKEKDLEVKDETSKIFADLFYYALDRLQAPTDFSFAGESFSAWVRKVIELAKVADRYEIACQHIGKVLFHAPADPCGLWIDKEAAINLEQFAEIRTGFCLEAINSRGVYIGSEGKEEEAISQAYAQKAAELRNAGFFVFAESVEDIAKDYAQQARMERSRNILDY